MLNIKKHKSVTSHQEIAAICQPLFHATKVNYFDYIRNYDDLSRIWLGTNPEWTIYLYNREYVKVTDFRVNLNPVLAGWYTWDGLANSVHCTKERQLFYQKLSDAKNSFHIMNGISFIATHLGFREYYSFGTDQQNCQIINEYLFNKEIFEKFIYYFKQKAKNIIDEIDRKRIILPYRDISDPTKIMTYHPIEEDDLLPIKKYYLSGEYRNIFLSKKQYECLTYLSRGYRVKSIAKILNISCRTVETHIQSAKRKLSCTTTSELLSLFNKLLHSA